MSRWGVKQNKELEKQFNLFDTTGGKEGWNPGVTNDNYIKTKICESGKGDLIRFLSKSLGGDRNNRDNSKAINGYKRAASEYFVKLAKQGVRLSAFKYLESRCCLLMLQQKQFSLILSILLLFTMSEKWIEDKDMTGTRKPGGVASKGSKMDNDTNDGDNSSESDDNDAGNIDDNLDQKAASGNRWDSNTTSNSFEQTDNDMEGLQDRIRSRLGLANYFHYVKDALFPYTLIAWIDPDSQQQYLEIKIEVLGSMIATDCVPKIAEGGSTVLVKFKFPDGGALLFPPCLLDQHEDNPHFDMYHPKYLQYEQAQ
jgi:hypothetical protein